MLDKLIVSIYDPIEWDREALHIEFDRQNDNWVFQYYSRPNEKPYLKESTMPTWELKSLTSLFQ
jgi:hypothetical protein